MYTLTGPLAGVASRHIDEFDDLGVGGLISCPPPLRALVAAKLAQRRPLVLIVPTRTEAETLRDDIAAYVGLNAVRVFDAWETLPHERLSPQPATVGSRLATLNALRSGEARVVIAPVRAALQPIDPRVAERTPLIISSQFAEGLEGLVTGLAQLGYTRTSLVTTTGEFAVRGGIVDVYGAGAEEPVRIEFFGDDVDDMRTFDPIDQRTVAKVETVTIHAARELVLDEETRTLARAKAKEVQALAPQLNELADGVAVEGAEGLVLALIDQPVYLTDIVHDETGLVVIDHEQVHDRAEQLIEQAKQLIVADWGALAQRVAPHQDDAGIPLEDERAGFAELTDLVDRFAQRATRGAKVWRTTAFQSSDAVITLHARVFDTWRGNIPEVGQTARILAKDEQLVVISVRDHGNALRIAQVLRDGGLAVDHLDDGQPLPRKPNGRIQLVESPLRTGFNSRELGIALIGEFDVFGARRTAGKRRIGSRKSAEQTVLDLEIGGALVHAVHGIGTYVGMQTRTLKGGSGTVTRDYVVVEYAGGDKLYVPSDQVDALAVYTGGEHPRIMRMGGADWERAKLKVKTAVKEMAADLMRLYSARMTATGHAFQPDVEMLAKLEESFPWVETADQLEAIQAVKEDMGTPLPMDRLICGDVGFGKTEVAVRAAAMAVFDNHQAAVLVPTTLLAQQHGETFIERFANTGITVKVLSRFSTQKEMNATLEGLKDGSVDIVVGTHRLLSTDVSFKNLGLLVVDEEQRFGVGHKERLKQLKTSVDVLTMSATPIPRTMEMAITGIRDMSTIETPPVDRQPVITQVTEWDEDLAVLALRRELLREGQVFWLHNKVDTIHAAADRIRELVPGARVAVGHGQMPEEELEQVMLDFWTRDIDVLVATTIIENGIDIPNANTLVVEDADRLGMSQLYQLRGRVGRSATRGYAHLFYTGKPTPEAWKRLESIATHSHLGAGMSVALKDLEIRGAGSMLGADQSGTVSGVGFDTYTQLMREAVAELGGMPSPEPEIEIKVDLPVDAHLPHDWITDEGLRLQAYRLVAGIRNVHDVNDVRAELTDRYGKPPAAAERLIMLAAFKSMLRMWGITEVSTTPRHTVRMYPVLLADSKQVRLTRKYPQAQWNPSGEVLELPQTKGFSQDPVGWLAKRLADILGKPEN
ncbi:transcription-repair coupling factor [Stomatohabitans albus]|uniref:transcription-repair coupling factor n=1 Tax=Stomatohabitans albus TaxID=3110766 RepID=UPI00300C22D5